MHRTGMLFALALLLGGCFSDTGKGSDGVTGDASGTGCFDDCGTTGASTGSTAGSGSGCLDDCGTDTGMDTDGDTSGPETGETDGTTDDSTDTGMDTSGDTGMDIGSGETDGMPCAVNNDCMQHEVCSAGLGECVDADAAVYEVTIVNVVIATPSQCYGDPDEVLCESEFYVVGQVGGQVVHTSPDIPGNDVNVLTGYSFLADLNVTDGFTFAIWDNDSNEANMMDDLYLTRTFNTPAAVLHDGFLSDSWNEGPAVKEVMLQISAQ